MSSITLKITSLIIRTLSKPIANQIKAQAREHPSFRRLCISFAQSLHRVDMRLRLGLLRDPAAIERQAVRDAEAAAAKHKSKVEAAEKAKQKAADAAAEPKAKDGTVDPKAEEAAEKAKEKAKAAALAAAKPKIRPLSEAKAIDTGATFISESFLFLVAAGLIVSESLRSRRKENTRREDVADRLQELEESEKNARRALVALEKEVIRLRAEKDPSYAKHHKRILPKEVWNLEEQEEKEDQPARGWWSRLTSFGRRNELETIEEEPLDEKQDEEKGDRATARASETVEVHSSPRHNETLAERISHSVAAVRQDAMPPPKSTGETEAIIDSTS